MGRKRKIETAIVLEQIEKYRNKHPDKKIKFVDLCKYMEQDGIFVEDRHIRRNIQIKNYVKTLNASQRQYHEKTVAYHKTIDVEEMFRRCNTTEKLKKEIVDLDCYYRETAQSAGFAFEELRKSESKIAELKNEILKLHEEVDRLKKKNKQIGPLIDRNRELTRYIKNVVNPKIASQILSEKDFIDEPQPFISNIDIFDSATDIEEFKSKLKEKLMEGFDE